MMPTSELDLLAARWAEQPDGTLFAPVAEGLRKRGSLQEAATVVSEGLARRPGHLPGYLVLARIRRDQGDWPGADEALRRALECDPTHPVVLGELAAVAEVAGRAAEARAWREARAAAFPSDGEGARDPAGMGGPDEPIDGMDDFDALDEGEDVPVLTESMATLYHRQGHTERAAEVYQALSIRHPEREDLARRADELRRELASRRPRPYAAEASGGRSLRDWLTAVAASRPAAPLPAATGFDAFFQAAPPPPDRDPAADFAAFQSWLKGLER